MTPEFTIAAWSHESGSTWRRFTEVDRWRSPSFERRDLQAGAWSMSLPFNAETDGIGQSSLLTVDFRSDRYTARVDHAEVGVDSKGKPTLNLSGTDALSFLKDSDCWPVPSTPAVAGDVTQASAYYTDSGATETVLRRLIKVNAIDRDGQPFTMADDQARGGSLSLKVRNTNLLEVVTRECRTAGLGVRVGLVSADPDSTTADLTCSFYVPRDRSKDFRISSAAGTLRSWSQSDDAPTATRALVAGGGEGADRMMRLVVDTAAEAASGRMVEMFVDARDIDKTASDAAAQLDKRGWQALAEAAAQSSSTIEATDAVGMRYDGGDLVQVSDWITVEPIEGQPSVQQLGAVVITQESGSGVKVSLVPGNPDGSDPILRHAANLRRLRRDVNALQRET